MKKQKFTLNIIDARREDKDGKPRRLQPQQFRDHRSFLKAVAANANTPGCHVEEHTETTIILHPQKTIKGLFE